MVQDFSWFEKREGSLLWAGSPTQDLDLQHLCEYLSLVAFRAFQCALVRSLRRQGGFSRFEGLLRCCVGSSSLVCIRQGSFENGKLFVVLDSLLMSCDSLSVDRLEASPHEHAQNIVFCKVGILWYRGEGRQWRVRHAVQQLVVLVDAIFSGVMAAWTAFALGPMLAFSMDSTAAENAEGDERER